MTHNPRLREYPRNHDLVEPRAPSRLARAWRKGVDAVQMTLTAIALTLASLGGLVVALGIYVGIVFLSLLPLILGVGVVLLMVKWLFF